MLTIITEGGDVALSLPSTPTPDKNHRLIASLWKLQRSLDPRSSAGGLRGAPGASRTNVPGPVALHGWERAPERCCAPNVPATVMPVRSAGRHNDNIYFEAAQDSRLNWAVLNLE